MPPDALHSAKTLISLKQLLLACQNAIRLSNDPHLPYRIGTTIHVSAYGIACGYAILCSTDFRKTMAFATSYHALAAPLGRMSFSEDGATATWTFEPIVHAAIDEAALPLPGRTADRHLHLAASRRHGARVHAPEIALAYEPADDFGVTDELTGCPLLFGQTVNRMTFDAKWLDEKPTLGNRTTYAAVAALCDDLLSDLALRTGTAGKIRAILLQNIAHRPTLEAAAATLGTTTRTLRRQLRHQGTLLPRTAGRTEVPGGDEVSARDGYDQRGCRLRPGIHRCRELQACLSPLDRPDAERVQDDGGTQALHLTTSPPIADQQPWHLVMHPGEAQLESHALLPCYRSSQTSATTSRQLLPGLRSEEIRKK